MSKKSEHTLQSIILKLQNFWADQGCLIWQPYHTEVGAGTMNPATALRVLGPEPWWVAYVEPSFRPADGRYGENPNRWQHYYQFQVILKPDPGNPQELYLESLLALGIDPEQHDIRFVEDNWETPMLGAWGLGWEVWLDGQEITQFTYFQQTGGQTLDPVSVELTYGLERILLALQGVDSFLELNFSNQLTYGEIKLRPEIEYCTYNFEEADVRKLEGLFDTYEAEAIRCLEADLIQPAHDFVLKCSHTFNLLDARGAVGVTERAAIYSRVRKLAEGVARGYESQRAEAGHPWIERWVIEQPEAPVDAESSEPLDAPADFLLEIGTEELPDADLQSALEQLESAVPKMLADNRLQHDSIEILGTPRRLVVLVNNLAPHQQDEVATAKGPPAERAFDDGGEPTAAAIGFARSKGVEVDDLVVEEVDGGRYVMVEVRQQGKPTMEVLSEQLPILIDDLSFGREMRWNQSGVSFSRPIRWLVSLHGEQVVPFSYADLAAGRTSRGLRFDEEPTWSVSDPQAYFKKIAERGLLLDPEERRAEISRQVENLAEEVGGQIIDDPALLQEVTNLVELPTALRGEFDEQFLQLPRPVLISVMRSHQRYFAVEKDGRLLNYFITVRNGGDQHLDTVRAGNEHVLRARFADAAYFVEKDLEQPLEAYLAQLETLTFESSLGSMRQKAERVEQLVALVADWLELPDEQKQAASRAAHLSKADLATQMVVEMTSLQGEMGRIYALEAGEDEAVALAIAEHYLPRFAGDRVPQSAAGLAVGLADRLDSLIGLFAAGMQPSGGGDPFALRRTAIGLIEALVAHEQSLDLRQALAAAGDLLPIDVQQATIQECLSFIERRQHGLLLAEGHSHDVVRAVLSEQSSDPAKAKMAVGQLETWMEHENWSSMLQNYARCVRITRDLDERYTFDPDAITEPATKTLWQVYQKETAADGFAGSVDDFFEALVPMVPAIEAFFEEVLVMAEDEAVKQNRLALLQAIAAMADGTVDLSHVEGF